MLLDGNILEELRSLNINMYNRIEKPKGGRFHLHDTCEVYFFMEGDISYFVEKSHYQMSYGDLIITNDTEIHAPVFQSNNTYERIIFHYSPAFLDLINLPGFYAGSAFYMRPNGQNNKVHLEGSDIQYIKETALKISELNKDLSGENLFLKFCVLSELAVFINRCYKANSISNDNILTVASPLPDQIIAIINYIDKNLDKNLSLDLFEKEFYINRTYLCYLFKKHMSKTLHQYIIYRRISSAKRLLSKGYNVSETSFLCGFNDYSNFIKTFKNITGKTPGSYRS